MRCIHPVSVALALLVRAASHADLAAQACDPVASYTVSRASENLFTVQAHLRAPASALRIGLSEAEGRPEGQAASVVDLQGFTGEAPTPVTYLGEGRWQAARPLTRIRYGLRADHDEVRWTGGGMDEVASHFGDTWFFVGDAFFLVDPAWPACPVQVAFDLPADWSVLAPWPGTNRRFTPSDVATLTDNAFAIGRFRAGEANAGTMQLSWVLDDRVAGIAPRLVPLMTTLPRRFAEFFGSTPAERYVVVVFQGPHMDGGAFQQSFTLQLGSPIREADAIVWTHGLAHEMLHLWVGNHIHAADPEALSWFTEGFTDYLAVTLSYRAGVFNEAMLQQRLANIIRRVRLAPMQSPGVGLVEAGREKHRHWARVYGGGAMVALLMEAADPAGFRAALRDLNDHADVAWTQEALLERMDQFTAGGASRALAAVDAGMEFGAIIQQLGPAGIEVTGFSPDEVYVRWAGGCTEPACVPAFLAR